LNKKNNVNVMLIFKNLTFDIANNLFPTLVGKQIIFIIPTDKFILCFQWKAT